MFVVNNYFKVGKHIFSFIDAVPESVDAAFAAAVLVGDPSVFRPVPVAGPWDRCPIIGHRPRATILEELKMTYDREEVELLHEELVSLHACYTGVGRAVPLLLLAA